MHDLAADRHQLSGIRLVKLNTLVNAKLTDVHRSACPCKSASVDGPACNSLALQLQGHQ